MILQHAVSLAAFALLALAAVWDIAIRKIPNSLCLAVACLALLQRGLSGGLPLALLAALIVAGFAIVAWFFGFLGGGDVKLLTAVTLLVPPARAPLLIASIAIAGGLLSVLYLLLSILPPPAHGTRPVATLWRVLRAERWRIRRRRSLPYACAIASGVLAVTTFG